MADVVQWTVTELFAGLQKIEDGFNKISADLKADQAQLTALWSQTKADTDATRRAQNQALLTPLIHQNSVLRLSYLAPIKDKYTSAVNAAADALRKAGYTAPNLSGLGIVVAIAPLAAVTAVTLALALLATAIVLTAAQRKNTATVAKLIGDPTTTPAQKQALLKAMTDANQSLPPPPGLDFGWLPWAIGGVLAIMVVPKLLPARRAA